LLQTGRQFPGVPTLARVDSAGESNREGVSEAKHDPGVVVGLVKKNSFPLP